MTKPVLKNGESSKKKKYQGFFAGRKIEKEFSVYAVFQEKRLLPHQTK